jgi:hypothetical protein
MAFGAVQSIGYTGVNITFGAADAFDAVAPGDRRFVWVKNASGVSTTVTIGVPGVTFGQANPDVAVVIPAGQERMIGPLVSDLQDPSLGNTVFMGITPTASVTGAFVDLPTPPSNLP